MRNSVIWSAIVIFGVVLAPPVLAEEGHDHSHGAKADARVGDAYPLAVDPVSGASLVEVDEPVVVIHEGRQLHFASQQTVEQFNVDPAKYLAKADAMIVEQQKPLYPMDTCLISGEKLGGDMGEPVDFVYGNRLVRFCCPGCQKTFLKEPAKYLEQLDEAVIAQQKPGYATTTCLISGEKLGGEMGEPIDYVIGNRLVRFCCAGCVKTFEKNPAKHLAMMADGHSEHADANHEKDHGGHAEHEDAPADGHEHHEHQH